MDEDPHRVMAAVHAAVDVLSALDQDDALAELAGEALGDDGAGEAGSDDEEIGLCTMRHQATPVLEVVT